MHEAQMHDLSTFITLTYDDKYLPEGSTLVKRHFQLFMKRLRKLHKHKIKFFHCGEYGDRDRRPHYHAILFGVGFADKKKHSTSKSGKTLYISKTLDDLWGLGHAWIGDVTIESAGYVARYALKKINGDLAEKHYENVDINTGEIHRLQPEYATMSNRPAIGKTWYEKFKSDVFPSDSAVFKGKQMSVPRYYDKLLRRENPELVEQIKSARIEKHLINKADSTPERLAVREEVKRSKIKSLQRNL